MESMVNGCALFFSGLCGLIHSKGDHQARVVLLNPEATGGPLHRPTLVLGETRASREPPMLLWATSSPRACSASGTSPAAMYAWLATRPSS